MRYSTKNNSGYIAIITAIFLAGITTAIAFALATSSFFGRYNTLLFNSKKTTRFLAESCLEIARYRLVQNSSYAGPETVTVDTYTCSIDSVQTDAGNSRKIITAAASFLNTKTVLKLTVNDTNLEKINLEELVN